jgi:hypothetical protein
MRVLYIIPVYGGCETIFGSGWDESEKAVFEVGRQYSYQK